MLLKKIKTYEALSLRYIILRHGRENLGFLWIIIEPMLLCLGVMVVWSIIKGRTEHGLQIAAVVFTGYMPLTLWRHMTGLVIYSLRSGKFLTNFRGISLLDIVNSRLILEFISVSASFVCVLTVLTTAGVLPQADDYSLILLGWLGMGILGFGFGLTVAALSEMSEIVEKFIPPIQYLILPFSGCFFMLDWVPDQARELLSYVPLVHVFETIRAGMFGGAVKTYGQIEYTFVWGIVFSGLGYFLIERVRDRVE